jgi:Glycosyltransferase
MALKILILNKLYWPEQRGGAEVSVRNLVRSFVTAGHEVTVVCLSERPRRESLDGAEIVRLPIRNLHWPYQSRKPGRLRRLLWHVVDIYNPWSKRDIDRVLSQFRPDIFFTNNISGFSVSVWSSAYEHHIPIVHTSRDYYLIHPNSTLYSKGREQNPRRLVTRLFAWLKKAASRKVSAYVGISQHIAATHTSLGYFPRASHQVIYNSVEVQVNVSDACDLVTSTAYAIGFLGRIDPTKGIEVLLQSMALLGDRFRLVIAGEGESSYVTGLKSIAPSNVEWIGRVNPDALFARVNALVVPSLWAEPLGRVVLEAYSFGRPVVGARSGGIPEIINEGITGFIYEPRNARDLAEAITKVSSLDPVDTRNNCLELAKNFTNEKVSRAYIGLFSELTTSQNNRTNDS